MDSYEQLQRAWDELSVEDKQRIISGSICKPGTGHQLDHDIRALNDCASHLNKAFESIWLIKNPDVEKLAGEIAMLLKRANELASSADEALNQNL